MWLIDWNPWIHTPSQIFGLRRIYDPHRCLHHQYIWCPHVTSSNMIWYDMIYGMTVWHHMIWYDIIWYKYNLTSYDIKWNDMTLYDMINHSSWFDHKYVCLNILNWTLLVSHSKWNIVSSALLLIVDWLIDDIVPMYVRCPALTTLLDTPFTPKIY